MPSWFKRIHFSCAMVRRLALPCALLFVTFQALATAFAPCRRAALLALLPLPACAAPAGTLKGCAAEAEQILGGLSSQAANVFAMTPAEVGEVNTRGPPKMGSFGSVEGPCSPEALRAAAEALARAPPKDLNRQQLEKLRDGPKRIVEAREAIVEANNQKQGARLFGAVKKYLEATRSLLVAAP